uniref:Uncharacterized protein n=1 Tax=Parastrongyloides trichosuri TaxID=131310 RepID=A0A0N4ZR21_PARTI
MVKSYLLFAFFLILSIQSIQCEDERTKINIKDMLNAYSKTLRLLIHVIYPNDADSIFGIKGSLLNIEYFENEIETINRILEKVSADSRENGFPNFLNIKKEELSKADSDVFDIFVKAVIKNGTHINE